MADESPKTAFDAERLKMAADIVAAYVSFNQVPAEQLGQLITHVHSTLSTLGSEPVEEPVEVLRPAVPVKKSVADDYIVCLEDGKKLKMLKRYLRSRYDMSPAEYRAKWGLPADYPMVAPNYAAQRSAFAKKIGLGKGGRRSKR